MSHVTEEAALDEGDQPVSSPSELLDGPFLDEAIPASESLADDVARLRADAELREVLADHGFSGDAYALFEEELARYGWRVTLDWLRSGYVFDRCRAMGLTLRRLPIPADDLQDLAQEVVGGALRAFKQKGLIEGGWQPERGASMKTYFTGALCLQFANVWRKRLRASASLAGQFLETLPPDTPCPDPGPAETFLRRDEIRRGLADISDEKTRIAVVLAEDGYQHEEIAEIIGPGVTPRAVEGYLRRHRQRQASRRNER
jgi:DNA-directed RNA polymerase specialized sigma24 family protein